MTSFAERKKRGLESIKRAEENFKNGTYEKYKAATQKDGDWRQEAIERLTPKPLSAPTSGETYRERLAKNREQANKYSMSVPAEAKPSVNIAEMIFGKPIAAGTVNPRISAADFSTRYNAMTERENAVYSYLRNSNTKKADDYLKAIEMDINQRNAEKRRADAKEIAEESTAAGLYERFMGNNVVSNGAATAYELWQGLRNEPVDPNHPLLAGQDIVAGQTEAFLGDSKGAERWLREGAMGAFDFGTNIVTAGALGLTGQAMQNVVKGSFAAQAFAGSADDAATRGGTGMQSVMTGTVSAALATIIEGAGLERLAEIGRLANARGVLKSMVKSILPEAAEEAAEEAGNILADAVIMGDKNEIVNLYNTARANGATQNDAMMGTLGAAGKQIGESAIVGGISGGMIGGGVSGLNRVLGRNALDSQRMPASTVDNTVEEVENGEEVPERNVASKATTPVLESKTAEIGTEQPKIGTEQPKMVTNENYEEELEDFGEKFYGEKGKEVFLRRARESGNLDHTAAFNTYYRAGVAGITESEIKQTAYTAGADKMLLNEAYMAGAMDRKTEIANAINGRSKLSGRRGLILGEDVKATEAQLSIAQMYAEIGGGKIRLVNAMREADAKGKMHRVNGKIEDGVITIATQDTDTFLGTMHHELVHMIRQVNPDGYDIMRELVFNLANKSGIDIERQMEEYKLKYGEMYGDDTRMTDIMEEMTADAFQKIFHGEESLRDFCDEMKKADRTVLEKIKEFFDRMLETLEGLFTDNTYTDFAEQLSKNAEHVKMLRDTFAHILAETGKMEAETQAVQTDDVKYSITEGMTEEERYQELKDRTLFVFTDNKSENHTVDLQEIEKKYEDSLGAMKSTLRKFADKIGIIGKPLNTPEVEIEFEFSKGGGVDKSANHQVERGGDFITFAKAMLNLEKLLETAVLMEIHSEKYTDTVRENRNFEKAYVLFSAFRDGDEIVPVQMEIKKTTTDGNRLYLLVSMAKIKAGVLKGADEKNHALPLLPAFNYRLSDIFAKINEKDRDFLKYVPDGFLNPEQLIAKKKAKLVEEKKLKKTREGVKPSAQMMREINREVDELVDTEERKMDDKMPTKDRDIRFSLRKNDIEAAIAESEHWKKAYEGLLKEFEITKEPMRDREAAQKVVRKFLKSIKSSYDEEKFLDRFVSLCNYGADMQGDSNYRDLVTAMTMLAEDALRESAKMDMEAYHKYADLRKELRSATLYVSADTVKDLEAQDIKYNELRTENFNKVKISRKSGGGIDTHYETWAEKYPELFKLDQHTSQAALLMDIVAVRKSLDPVVKNPYFEQLEDYAESFAYELLGMMNDIALEDQTFADKYEEKLRQQREESRQALKNAKEQAKNEKKLLREKYATNAEARIEAIKQKYEKRLDRKEYWRLRKLAVKDAKALAEWLKTPTDKNHVPKKFKESVSAMLALIETEKPDLRIPLQNFVTMKHGLMELYGDSQGIYLYVEKDDQVINILERFENKYPNGANLDTMDGTDMKYFRNLIASVKKACMDANKMHTSQRERTAVSVSEGFINASQAKKDARETGMIRRVQDFLGLEMLDANSFFKRIGGDVYSELWKGLRKGLDKKVLRWKEAMDFINDLVDPKDVRAWTDEVAKEFEIGGVKVYLTIPQIMSLACLMRRSQGRQHIIGMDIPTENGILQIKGGGFKAEPLGKDKKAKLEKAKVVEPNETEVRAIIATLTEEQARVAYAMQQYLSNEVAAWGNETSMMMFGYEKFLTENYFPIVSDKNFVNQLVTKVEDIAPSLRSMGITKNVNQYANNPVIIQDIFKVFANHVDQMSNYNAFVASESDFNKFMNYKVKREDGRIYSVKDEMDRTMGAGGAKYIKTLMNRLVTTTGLSDDSDFAKMFVRNMKVASVGANLRVIVQQPTAYLRAANYLDLKYLLNPAIFKKIDREIIYRYAPIALWKSWGNYEMDTGKTMYEQIIAPTKFAWTKEKLMAGAGAADKLTWSRLWNACELEARDKHPGLSDEEIYKIAGERFGEIVDESQVVDSILHRSQIMRKKGLYTQMATSFMSEPTKTFNMASNALVELLRNNTPENRKKFARCYMTIIATGIATACAAGLVDAMRDDDDDERFLEKWRKAVAGDFSEAETPGDVMMVLMSNNIADNLNPMNMIPYLRDVWSLIQGYDIKRTDFDWLNDILKSMKRWENFIAGESEYTLSSMLMNTAGAVSKMAGIPIGSATRDLKAMSNLIVLHIIGEDEAKYKYRKLSKDIGSAKNTGDYVERMLQAKFSGNDGLATRIYNEMIAAGISNEKIDSKIDTKEKALLKEEPAAAEAAAAYAAGNYNEYMKALDSLTAKGYGQKNAVSVIESIYNKENGSGQEEAETFETITEGFWDGETEEETADYEMIFNAYMNGSKADYNQMWDVLKAAGKEEKNIKQSMRNRLKKAYQAAKADGNYQEAQKVKSEFLRLGGKPETLEKE